MSATNLADPKTANEVADWIKNAETYASAEKRFVDEVIGYNAGALDLEMGLPAGEAGDAAPRMDLVLAQTGLGNATQIAFWEAKCSNNSELRAVAHYEEEENGKYVRGPRVIHQLRKYQNWVGRHDPNERGARRV